MPQVTATCIQCNALLMPTEASDIEKAVICPSCGADFRMWGSLKFEICKPSLKRGKNRG
ncbi:hypothetical protein [Jiella sp. M17.18]|uniref:hypothetical protein n=1 Tax=Jiella sp. M17.18 TaxID=3234247 RepID=UPI0034DFE24B